MADATTTSQPAVNPHSVVRVTPWLIRGYEF